MNIIPIPALKDNYIWVIEHAHALTVIDPGESQPVLNYAQEHNLNITDILITHHHHDHTGGVKRLKHAFPQALVVGPKMPATICPIDYIITQEAVYKSAKTKLNWTILQTPGHTLDHICYYLPGILFCGDTLFSAGCGRLFEGTALDMYTSLKKIYTLPDSTKIYPAHEYTLNNISFAEKVMPDSSQLQEYKVKIKHKRSTNHPSLPTSLEQEKAINPFLRSHCETLKAKVNQLTYTNCTSELDVFTALRKLRDNH